jgi:hypothetical protein
MSGSGRYLKPILDSGSSRVFNCNDIVHKLERENVENPYIFKNRSMHNMVLIKEALARDDMRHPQGFAIGTKLYVPYNNADVYEGGRSIFLHSPHLLQVFQEQFGVRDEGDKAEGLAHDLRILNTLDELPSLDGFLMRDALELEGIAVNEHYCEVTATERVAIGEYIRGKMEPLVRAAYGGQRSLGNKVTQLIDKVWEAKDIEALEPLIQAFRLPRHEALDVFSAWKGIIFYAFEHDRARAGRESFAFWLKEVARPRQAVTRHVGVVIEETRRATVERLRAHWLEVATVLDTYERLYADFVASANPGGFIAFLRGATDTYWQLGDSLSKINLAINCWDLSTQSCAGRRLSVDQLENLLTWLKSILLCRLSVPGQQGHRAVA